VNPGFIKCPLCKHPVGLARNGLIRVHWAVLGKPGGGYRSLSQKCSNSNKRPEETES
jgi:hypothetical protein